MLLAVELDRVEQRVSCWYFVVKCRKAGLDEAREGRSPLLP